MKAKKITIKIIKIIIIVTIIVIRGSLTALWHPVAHQGGSFSVELKNPTKTAKKLAKPLKVYTPL